MALVLVSAKAQAANLQPETLNDPVFNELIESPSEEVSSDDAKLDRENSQDIRLNAANNEMNVNDPLAEAPVNGVVMPKKVAAKKAEPVVKRFLLGNSDAAIRDEISEQVNEKNIGVSDVNFKRVGGTRVFGMEQVKKVILSQKFAIQHLDINKDSEEFTAIVKPQIGAFEIEVSGKFSAGIKIPLIAKTVNKGNTITQEDIELKIYPKNKLTDDSIVNVSDLIGKSATKVLTKGTAVKKDDVKTALLIRKNATVSAIYRNNNIEIKALAIAQEDGSVGDIINLKNYDTGKGFKAMVKEDGSVAIEINNGGMALNYAASTNVN